LWSRRPPYRYRTTVFPFVNCLLKAMATMARLLVAMEFVFLMHSLAQPVTPQDLETRERELTNLLQARLQTFQGERTLGNVRSLLGKGSNREQDTPQQTSTTPQNLNIPSERDAISPQFWHDAEKILNTAGMSTPIPSAAHINAPPPTAAPTTWQEVMQDPKQPLNTKIGGAVMFGLSGPATATPPPQQAAISQQFIAQCPMVLFEKNLSIRAPSCNDTLGGWIDTNPLNTRTVLRWRPKAPAGLFFGVDSALTGPGSALFGDISERFTLTGYHFVLKNCLGVDRWHVEENVYKIDSMGKVSSTMELHDVTTNAEAFFIKYVVKSPTGITVAESNLFRMLTNQVNFTEFKDGQNTGRVLAVATRQGQWTKKGWEACMSPTSPRGWSLYFPQPAKTHESVATVQDIRVAIATTITLMAYRNENRGADGLNNQGSASELYSFVGALVLALIACVLTVNFCMVFQSSGIKDKLKKTFKDTEGLLPKRPMQQRQAPLHATY